MNQNEQRGYVFGAILALANKLQNLGDEFDPAVSTKQWLLLAAVYRAPSASPTLSELSQMTGTSRQNIKKLALILQRKGFVTLSRDQSDGRAIGVSVTATCEQYFVSRESREQEFMEELFAGFGPMLLSGAYEGMVQLAQNIETMERRYEKTND